MTTPTKHKYTITNGAAHVANAILLNGVNSLADIWTAKQLRDKIKPAAKLPEPNDAEKFTNPLTSQEMVKAAYNDRIEKWLAESFSEVEMEEDERDVLKAAFAQLGTKEALPKGQRGEYVDYIAELIGILGLHKK